jgi:hypothetical protein
LVAAAPGQRGGVDVDRAVLKLYGLAPEEFTAARNALVKAAKDAGDHTVSDSLRAPRKPTLVAWLANQLMRTEPDQINDLTGLGDQLREAHLSADGARLRELTPKRHRLVQALVRTAEAQAMASGRTVTVAVAERLTETLDAALVDPGAAELLRSGRLTSALRHVGFGVVDETGQPAQIPAVKAATPRTIRSKPAPAAKKPARSAPTDDEALLRRRKELGDLVAEADAEYDEAEAERAKAESELDASEHHLADMRTAIERLNDELERVRHELKQAQGQMPRLERRLKIASRAAEKAARQRDSRRQRLDNFGT